MLGDDEQHVLRQLEEQLTAEDPDLSAEMRRHGMPLIRPDTEIRLRVALCASAAVLLAVGQPSGAFVALSVAGLWQYYAWQVDPARRIPE